MNQHVFQLARTDRRVSMVVIGAGGTGSHVLNGLARLHLALRAFGHPGLQVTAIDPDTVSESNVVRQLFMPHEIGASKATVLIHRLNLLYGLDWNAHQGLASDLGFSRGVKFILGCVDNAAARKQINRLYVRHVTDYWLDFGNRSADGQAVLGYRPAGKNWLPCIADLYPEILVKSKDDDDTPSCSLAESLSRQDLFINPTLANAGLNILWQLLRYGHVTYHGTFVNLQTGRQSPLPVDRAAWLRINPELHIPYTRRKAA
ncbi:PRTRC system ThiF family protein [Acidithiobacillus ferrivorans]|nr:PRTRC system ThiF family protein [Acidithiobacillus ferrivorans]